LVVPRSAKENSKKWWRLWADRSKPQDTTGEAAAVGRKLTKSKISPWLRKESGVECRPLRETSGVE
jgi:hypothetical protein